MRKQWSGTHLILLCYWHRGVWISGIFQLNLHRLQFGFINAIMYIRNGVKGENLWQFISKKIVLRKFNSSNKRSCTFLWQQRTDSNASFALIICQPILLTPPLTAISIILCTQLLLESAVSATFLHFFLREIMACFHWQWTYCCLK